MILGHAVLIYWASSTMLTLYVAGECGPIKYTPGSSMQMQALIRKSNEDLLALLRHAMVRRHQYHTSGMVQS